MKDININMYNEDDWVTEDEDKEEDDEESDDIPEMEDDE